MRHPFVLASLLLAALLPAQKEKKAPAPASGYAPTVFSEFPVEDGAPLDVEAATAAAIAGMLGLAEGDDDQWPYEGVYREDRGQLPVGYRVGGTSIAMLGLVAAPGFRADADRKAAVTRGLTFVLDTLEQQRMTEGFEGTYDVRGWGHIYALTCFLQLRDHGLVPKALADRVADRTGWLVKVLCGSAIPQAGGWNYSRRRGYLDPRNTASTFMTAPALQALFHARARGYEVDEQVVQQALDALERARSKEGGYAYGAPLESRRDVADADLGMMDKTPSAAARATACETTLMLAGRGDKARLEKAIELFFAHWDDLAVRKSKTGTHIPPYGIAPYYFLFGHVYCAQAIEMLTDEAQRERYRLKLRTLLARSREADGTWNDRQFARSAGYGTAMALLVMHMPGLPRPFAFEPGEAAPAGKGEAGKK